MAILDDVVSKFTSFQGQFKHTVYFVSEGAIEIEEGTLFAEKGGKLRWNYSKPEGKVFVSDGKTAWLYLPDDNRAYKIKISHKKKLPILARIFLGEIKPSKEFFCISAEEKVDLIRIELGSAEKNVAVRRLQVEIDKLTGFFSEISYLDEFDNMMTFNFAGGQSGKTFPKETFQFTPPKNAKISEEAEELGEEMGF